ncbi:MAG TPA: DUF507 family protein [Thermoanaerobaculia bacterium]|nr:DUF507 family protein [Thermoanaerobaculia bacterium]
MLKVSKDRIAFLARQIVDEMHRHGSVRLVKDPELVRQGVAHALLDELKHDEEHHRRVMGKIGTMSDPPPGGSKEWDAAYRHFLDEEYDTAGLEPD